MRFPAELHGDWGFDVETIEDAKSIKPDGKTK